MMNFLLFNLDSTTICSNPNPHQRIQIHLVPNGKLLIVKLQQKILVQVEPTIRFLQIMVVLLLIVVAIGKSNLSIIIEYFSLFLSSSSKTSTSYSSAANDGDAQKRFSNAKAISSDQFFNKDSDVCTH
jgi:hypothetical protein